MDLSSSSSLTELTIPATSRMVGQASAAELTHLSATCRRRTTPSSLAPSARRRLSNTSTVHSSRTTDCTHRARSDPSLCAAFPVSSSRRTSPKLRTSDLNGAAAEVELPALRDDDDEKRRWSAAAATTEGGDVRPYSLMQGSMLAVNRMFEDLKLPWAIPSSWSSSCMKERPSAMAVAMFSLLLQPKLWFCSPPPPEY
ncbi:hypothetical protein ACMD2_07915 [Ananas comosus]|uniref:Uncharacterized protein n=1 Tax=Ananas comosus TaxID=4615 RepID=A0A199UIT9_ANACO|nr:hypothetical protein ACMD2_07915 [Ananas comosus]